MAKAGWYPDPQLPDAQAYWDGVRWTGDRRALPPAPLAPPAADETQAFTPFTPPPAYGQQYGQPWPPAQPAAPPPRSRRGVLVTVAAVVVLGAGAVTTWLVWPGDDGPSLTYHGRAVANADRTLTAAEAAVARTVTARHGARAATTRCYFTQPTRPARGTPATDVGDDVLCGPVLFIDGDRAQEYLSLPLTNSAASGDAVLRTAAPDDDATPRALPGDAKPVRPDGTTPPAGAGGLTPPTPPPATRDLLTSVDSLGAATTAPAELDRSRMIGRSTGVEITAAGVVSRYGDGDTARSAPSGQKLIAFRYDYIGGDLDSSDDTRARLAVTAGGRTTRRDLPDPTSDGWVVAAVPASGSAVVEMAERGLPQTLSLPAGTPGTGNLTVLARAHRSVALNGRGRLPVRLTNANGVLSYTAVISLNGARLGYWAPANPSLHASRTDRALLAVDVDYTDTEDPGDSFGFPTGVMSLRLADGTVVRSRNVASDRNKITNAFDVPAGFTRGTLVISGSSTDRGLTFTARGRASFTISIAAG